MVGSEAMRAFWANPIAALATSKRLCFVGKSEIRQACVGSEMSNGVPHAR